VSKFVRVIEIASDIKRNVLWIDTYPFKGLHDPGETFIRNYMGYMVISSILTPVGDVGVVQTTVEFLS